MLNKFYTTNIDESTNAYAKVKHEYFVKDLNPISDSKSKCVYK